MSIGNNKCVRIARVQRYNIVQRRAFHECIILMGARACVCVTRGAMIDSRLLRASASNNRNMDNDIVFGER